jgi:hypothetical protein
MAGQRQAASVPTEPPTPTVCGNQPLCIETLSFAVTLPGVSSSGSMQIIVAGG